MAIGTSNIKITDLLTETGASSASLKAIWNATNVYCKNRPLVNSSTSSGITASGSSTLTSVISKFASSTVNGTSVYTNNYKIISNRPDIKFSEYSGYNHNAIPSLIVFFPSFSALNFSFGVANCGARSSGINIGTDTMYGDYYASMIIYDGTNYNVYPIINSSNEQITYKDLASYGHTMNIFSLNGFLGSSGTTYTAYPVIRPNSSSSYYYPMFGACSFVLPKPNTLTKEYTVLFGVAKTTSGSYKYTVTITSTKSIGNLTFSAYKNYILYNNDAAQVYINSGSAITISAGNSVTYTGYLSITPNDLTTYNLYLGGALETSQAMLMVSDS